MLAFDGECDMSSGCSRNILSWRLRWSLRSWWWLWLWWWSLWFHFIDYLSLNIKLHDDTKIQAHMFKEGRILANTSNQRSKTKDTNLVATACDTRVKAFLSFRNRDTCLIQFGLVLFYRGNGFIFKKSLNTSEYLAAPGERSIYAVHSRSLSTGSL